MELKACVFQGLISEALRGSGSNVLKALSKREKDFCCLDCGIDSF